MYESSRQRVIRFAL